MAEQIYREEEDADEELQIRGGDGAVQAAERAVVDALDEMGEATTGVLETHVTSTGPSRKDHEAHEPMRSTPDSALSDLSERTLHEGTTRDGDDDAAPPAKASSSSVTDLEKGHGSNAPAPLDKKAAAEAGLQDQTNLLPTRQVIIVFAGLSCAIFCTLLDQTIVSTALPTLGRVFGRADISSWLGTAYLLTSTAMQPMYGRFSDIFGRKIVLLVALAIFFIGSLACALAQSMIQLIVFRALAGVGGGGILTLVMIIISDVVSLKERGKYQGLIGGVVAISNSLGPLLGGIFTEEVSWRWCFVSGWPPRCSVIFAHVSFAASFSGLTYPSPVFPSSSSSSCYPSNASREISATSSERSITPDRC